MPNNITKLIISLSVSRFPSPISSLELCFFFWKESALEGVPRSSLSPRLETFFLFFLHPFAPADPHPDVDLEPIHVGEGLFGPASPAPWPAFLGRKWIIYLVNAVRAWPWWERALCSNCKMIQYQCFCRQYCRLNIVNWPRRRLFQISTFLASFTAHFCCVMYMYRSGSSST